MPLSQNKNKKKISNIEDKNKEYPTLDKTKDKNIFNWHSDISSDFTTSDDSWSAKNKNKIEFGSSTSNSSHSEPLSRKRYKKSRKNKGHPSESKLCAQSFSMIKFLGTMNIKKLELKHEPKQRRTAFLEWIGCLEVAFSNYKYTRRILTDYSTNHKIHNVVSDDINRLVYSVCYAFMDKTVRTSTSMYKDNGIALLKALHIKCASINSKTRNRAKQAFLECRITQDETSIGFLSRLERKANEARLYDVKISEYKFIKTLLNNMKHHKYYRTIIAALLTTFE